MINKDDFISGVRNIKTNDLKFQSVVNNKTIINNGYFLYENIRYYMFSKRITISKKTQDNPDIGFDFPIVAGYRKSIGSSYSFDNPIFCISSLDKILTTDTQQEYININDVVNIDFSIDYDGKEYFIVFNQDYNEDFYLIFNQGENININLSNVYNDKFILGEKSNVLSNLSIECTNDDRKNNIFSFLSTLTNNQNVPIANKDIAFYKISTIYDRSLLDVKIDVERLYENKEFQKISNNELYIPDNIGVDITELQEHDIVVSDQYLSTNTEIINIDKTNRIITLSNNLNEDTPTDVPIQLIYRNIYKSFFDDIISTDSINGVDGTYWTGYQMIISTVTDELGNATSGTFKINTYEDKVFIFSALEDKSLQSELYWIDLSSNYISNKGNAFLDDMHYKLASQEALTAMGVDIWNEFWSEDVDAPINVEEKTPNTDWYTNRRNWRNSHYFLERAPINYTVTEDGDGSLQNPYKILSYSDLETRINSELQTDKHYILLNDIEVKITDNILNYFKGTLDGQGYTINILDINKNEDNIGLFKELDNAKINNLIIKVNTNGSVKGVNNVGILAGLSTGNTIITRVSCYGNVEGQNYVGGIIGKCEGSLNISFSSFNGNIINSNSVDENTYVGGIVSYVNYSYNSEYSKLTNIHTEGNIYTDSTYIINNYIFAGGICGYVNNNTSFVTGNKICKYLISVMNIEDVSNNSKTVAASIFGYINTNISYFDNVISLSASFTNVYSNSDYQSNKLIGTYENNIVNTYSGCSLDTTTINGVVPETSQPNGTYYNITFFRNLDNYNKTENNLSFNIKYIWKATSKNNFYNGFPIFTWQQDILDDYQDGTAEYPWHINNAVDLDNLRKVVNNGEEINNWSDDAYYIMTQDIYPSLLTINWTPIGTITNPFKGHFDGGDHEIIDLQYSGNHDKPIGLFGCLNGAEIHNLTVMANISHTKNYTGSIAGIAKNHSLIQNCYVSSSFDINSDLEIEDEATGLICGYLEDSNIVNCIDNDGVILNINNNRDIRQNVGGICGKVGKVLEDENNEYNHIENCKIDCRIQGLFTNVGGVLGYCDADNAVIQNNNCLTTIYWIDSTTVNYTTNMSKFVGGICGYIENAYKIAVNLFRGKNIEGLTNHLCGSNYIGGICGKINNSVIFENNETLANLYIDSMNSNAVVENIYLGGIVGYNKLTNINKCIFNGNIGGADITTSFNDIYICGIAYYINSGITKCYSIINNFTYINDTKGYRIGISENNTCPNLDNNYAKAVGNAMDQGTPGVDDIRNKNGLTLTVEALEDQNTYIGYDFDEIWMMSSTYPILQISTLHTVVNLMASLSYLSETKHTITSEPLGRWNFNDYYNKYLKDTSILLSSAREHIGNYMSCAYQGYLGHIKLTGKQILDMTKKGPDGYLENPDYKAIQQRYGTKDTLEDVILNAEDDFYTIAYNLVPRTEYKNWLENFKNTYDIASNNEGDYYMLDFDRRLGTVFESPFPHIPNTPEYLKPNSVVTSDFGDQGYDYSKVDGSDTHEADLDWLRRISKVEHINPLGSFNQLLNKLNDTEHPDVVHYDIYFSEGSKPPTWQELTYVFYIPSIIYYDNDHELKPDVFFDIILNSGCYFRGLAVMYAFCSIIKGLERYDDNSIEGNLQYPYTPYYSDFTLGSLIDEYIYTDKSTQESINLKHYKL